MWTALAMQVPVFVFNEVQQLLKSALEVRRKYMDLSLQQFCQTTENMLDKKLPPSSAFCVPDVLGGAKFTAAGDIMSCESALYYKPILATEFCQNKTYMYMHHESLLDNTNLVLRHFVYMAMLLRNNVLTNA